jgi:hypothetical protein
VKKNPECPKIKGKLCRSICPITNTLDVIGDKVLYLYPGTAGRACHYQKTTPGPFIVTP